MLGVALGKRDEDSLTSLAGRLARLDREITDDQRRQVEELSGKPLSQLASSLLRAIDPDVAAEKATGTPGASPAEVAPDLLEKARQQLVAEACQPFDRPVLRDYLAQAKQEAEQTIDVTTIDVVTAQGFDAAAREKALSFVRSFREYVEEHQAEITALQILYSRPYRQRLTEPMLKELERKGPSRSTYLGSMRLVMGGRTIQFPKSMIAPLYEPHWLRFQADGRKIYLIIDGLDAADSYRAVFTVDNGIITQRLIAHGEFPHQIWERTQYHDDFDEHPERYKNM